MHRWEREAYRDWEAKWKAEEKWTPSGRQGRSVITDERQDKRNQDWEVGMEGKVLEQKWGTQREGRRKDGVSEKLRKRVRLIDRGGGYLAGLLVEGKLGFSCKPDYTRSLASQLAVLTDPQSSTLDGGYRPEGSGKLHNPHLGLWDRVPVITLCCRYLVVKHIPWCICTTSGFIKGLIQVLTSDGSSFLDGHIKLALKLRND